MQEVRAVPSPFEQMSRRMEDLAGDRGALKETLRSGSGPVVPADALVSVYYSAYVEHANEPFDSNVHRKVPGFMKLGRDITLVGMELGVRTMREGEFARFLLKPEYAYGRLGCPPRIPPNATVLLELEMLGFLDTSISDEYFALSQEDQTRFPLDKLLRVAETQREFGNYYFRKQRFEDAKDKYKKALAVFSHRHPESEQELERVQASKLLLFLNMSLVGLRLNAPRRALVYGERALDIDQHNPKALFRCGQACFEMLEYNKARVFLLRAQKRQPFNPDINRALVKLDSSYRDWSQKEKNMCSKMFGSSQAQHVQD
ncbi:inactive peptidyl-prolyl cis-trans isomerase FKBP6 [Callorhinchus milii]|uniref:peptidylprolyl isomerase n=1 Tax=Callorhinchus milii TaxID=7868 RepID=V9KQ66_CALMI|nr:inactive peptidyl-prolyl cis-trans isomerase FKBP6 [Callorhinchus milii]XP_042201530.1 inactive peptidyl-prolyl cis-trans isomerase FKBP6 [Callorhinchus milii]|eukprot:gi/632957693/ref/XP_007894626.1/ PREDICTED: inactive peptidyl-prolyl cis-trans isomerase FKBP6 [Callorhinchus milii]